MKKIEIKNKELSNLLEDFSSWFESIDKSKIKLKGKSDFLSDEYFTTIEYLATINEKKHLGWPESTYGIDLEAVEVMPLEWRKEITDIDKNLKLILSSPNCAVKMYYPKEGYMGWHNNHNAAGYNILLSYTKNGKGFFRYKDPITHEIITMNDDPGWTAKVGYYGTNKEPDRLYWHCARAHEDRLTLGFVIPDKNMWEMMCEDIQVQ